VFGSELTVSDLLLVEGLDGGWDLLAQSIVFALFHGFDFLLGCLPQSDKVFHLIRAFAFGLRERIIQHQHLADLPFHSNNRFRQLFENIIGFFGRFIV
jgi:hypothetical protein